MEPPRISVIVRARDEAPAIGRCLQTILGQELPDGLAGVPPELIVVDNDSRDGTAEIARRHGAAVVPMSTADFSFGGALNLGAAHANGEILVALSAHAFPLDGGWLARIAAAFDDPSVACVCGERFWPDGSVLTGPVRFDAALANRYPEWGYSNAAGAFRASLWRERPFREDLPACEDREWGRHWVLSEGRGYVCVLDPGLVVDHDHTHDPVLSIYRRARREAQGFAAFLPDGAMKGAGSGRVGGLLSEWWGDRRFYDSAWTARLSHRRAARLLGVYAGAGRVEKSASTLALSTRNR